MLLPSAGLLLPLLVLVLLERASATHSSSSPAAAAGPLPPELLRASGSDVHPTTGSVATRFALDPSNGCSFTWAHQAGANRAVVQAAFQLRVWDASTGHVAYDSGFCNSSDPSHYLPAGSLKTARGYVWRVSWWDGDGRASALSNEAAFHVGPDAAGWEGVPWIGANASNVYRATGLPVTEEAATSVILYICALGFGKVTVNGRAADGDGAGRMAVSGWTNNERLNLYETYDLTAVARSSSARNEPIVLGVQLGHGWRAPVFARNDPGSQPGDSTERVFRAQLIVTNRDGTSINILNTGNLSTQHSELSVFVVWFDFANMRCCLISLNPRYCACVRMFTENWEMTAGPVIADSVYNGEIYDAQLALPAGWDTASSPTSARWVTATEIVDPPRGQMMASAMPPITLDRIISPRTITQPSHGLFVCDFGENVAGWAVLKRIPPGKPGQRIVIKYAEVLQHKLLPDLNSSSIDPRLPYFKNLRSANSTNVFILPPASASTSYSYTPSFTYHG